MINYLSTVVVIIKNNNGNDGTNNRHSSSVYRQFLQMFSLRSSLICLVDKLIRSVNKGHSSKFHTFDPGSLTVNC